MATTFAERFDFAEERREAALRDLLRHLLDIEYDFVTPTPATHGLVFRRKLRSEDRDLRDVLGWSLPFRQQDIDQAIFDLLRTAQVLDEGPDGWRSLVRVSRLRGDLYLHTAYPTDASDAVFLGPDSYRFANLVSECLSRWPRCDAERLVDVGAGAGVGAIAAARCRPGLQITMSDINPKALELARINADTAGVDSEFVLGEGLGGVSGNFDVILANPPYVIDDVGRDYRDGGGMFGGEVTYKMAAEAVTRLVPGGRLILYTGSAIVDGRDLLYEALGRLATDQDCELEYQELDPDVFGEELAEPAYQAVERIAVAAAVMTARDRSQRSAWGRGKELSSPRCS